MMVMMAMERTHLHGLRIRNKTALCQVGHRSFNVNRYRRSLSGWFPWAVTAGLLNPPDEEIFTAHDVSD
jgi:hypothetical protein